MLTLEDRIVRVVDGQSVLCIYPRIVRFSPDNFHEQLANYVALRAYLREKERAQPLPAKEGIMQAEPRIIDMRLGEMAFF